MRLHANQARWGDASARICTECLSRFSTTKWLESPTTGFCEGSGSGGASKLAGCLLDHAAKLCCQSGNVCLPIWISSRSTAWNQIPQWWGALASQASDTEWAGFMRRSRVSRCFMSRANCGFRCHPSPVPSKCLAVREDACLLHFLTPQLAFDFSFLSTPGLA